MRISKAKFVSGAILIITIIVYSCVVVSGDKGNYIHPLCWISFAIIGAISIFEIIGDTYNYSLNKIHWYFIFIFMFLSPLSQLSAGYYPWRHKIENDIVFLANLLLILWEVVYVIGYNQLKSKRFVVTHKSKKKKVEIVFSNSMNFLLITASITALILMVTRCGLVNLFIRDASMFGNGTFSIMFTYLFRAIPVLSTGILILEKRKGNFIPWIEIIAMLACTFVLNFPVALSRYWSGAVYLGLLLCAIPPEWFRNRVFDYVLILALAVGFPLFSFFKYNTFSDLITSGLKLDIFSIYNNVDFDAYSMLCRIIEYTQTNGFTYGTQLRSVLLFFVPRAIWNIKGTPTGTLVATAQDSYYVNVSAPLMGEGYIDFGILGLIFFSFILSRIILNLDRDYWNGVSDQKVKYSDVVFVFLAGFLLFLLRGALQPSFLRVMGFFLFLIILFVFQKLFVALRRSSS